MVVKRLWHLSTIWPKKVKKIVLSCPPKVGDRDFATGNSESSEQWHNQLDDLLLRLMLYFLIKMFEDFFS
jgi:hypothetical protein